MAWLGGWGNRKKITISNANVDAILSNFPILIKISASSGTGSTDITDIFTELTADANRKKIAVTTSDGTTQCYVEIERWDHANSKAWLWIKAPSVASGSVTELYIYYDSSQADNTTYIGDTGDTPAQSVWDSNFKLVMHMAQDPNGDVANAIKDSTSNANHGTPGGSMTSADLVDGKIGKAIDFDGNNDVVDSNHIFAEESLTIECIVKSPSLPAVADYTSPIDNDKHGKLAWDHLNADYKGTFGGQYSGAWSKVSFGITSVADPLYLVGVATASRLAAYRGGVLINEDASPGTPTVNTLDLVVGKIATLENYFPGVIDEIRLSDTDRGSAWIKATYYSNWDGLVEYGPSEFPGIQGIQNALSSIGELIKTLGVINSLGEQSQDGIINSLGEQSQEGILNPIGEQAQDGIINSLGEQSQDGILNSFGEQSQDSIPCALGFEAGQLIKMDLSLGVQQFQSLLQRLCQGDPFVSLQSLINKLVYDKHKIQGIVNVINSSLEGTQSLLQQLCEGDPFVSLQSLKNKLVDDKHKVQKIFSTVASSVEGVQSLLQQICKGDPFVWFQSLKNKLTDDKRKVQKILNTLTSSIEGVQSLFQSISLGDPFVSLQALTNKLTNDKRGIQGAINTITASIEGVQSLLQQLCKGDPFMSAQALENKLADDKRGLQKILNTVTSSVEGLQSLLQQICEGDPFISLQSLKNKLTDDKRRAQSILNVIAGSIEGIQPLLQSMSLGDVASLQKVLSEMAGKDFIISQQKLLQTLQGLTSASFPAVEYDILLDGISIKNKINGAVVNYREDSVHNSIEIQSADCDLFWDCDPVEMEGTSRIEISVGTRQIYFLLEKRTGDEQSFSIWGRSLSAREDSPYAEDLEYSLVEPKSAKDVVEEILTVSALNWQCDDWTLPASFEFEGVPLNGITQIVAAIGAVVRCEDDGTICVRQKFPVRPVDMDGSVAGVNYDRKDLTKLSYDHIKGTHYNAIEVTGCTDDVDLPDILVEESAPEMGDDVHIRVYWAGEKPSGIIETYVTDGKITSLGEEVEEEEEAEVVAFEDGVASVSKPITSIVSVEWIGDSGGEVTYDKYSKDLEIGDGAYRVAKVTYKTTYSRYRLDSHDVEMLLALLTFGGESDVSVFVKMGEGDRPASELYGSLLTSESIAVVVGTAWLDANRYDYKKVKLETPYNDNALDGVLAYVNDAKIDCVGNFHIESSNIIISGPKVINELEVVQCQV